MHRIILITAVALAAAACSSGGGGTATATLEPRSGSQVTGSGTFTDQGGKVEIKVTAKSLPPGPHGVYLHEKGDCTGSNAAAVGPHFNPPGTNRVSDLGNLEAGADGTGTLTKTVEGLTVAAGDRGVTGRAIVISSDRYDPAKPAETTFGIISCGVIEKAS